MNREDCCLNLNSGMKHIPRFVDQRASRMSRHKMKRLGPVKARTWRSQRCMMRIFFLYIFNKTLLLLRVNMNNKMTLSRWH